MEELLQKAKIDDYKLRKLIFTYTANELTRISEPCYFPQMKKYYYELLNITGLTERDISSHVLKFYKGTSASKWKFHNDPKTNFYIFLMYYFLKKKDLLAYNSMMVFYTVRNYSNLMNKHWPKYCKEDVFRYTLEKLVRNHLFSREKTISGGLYFLAEQLRLRYTVYLEAGSLEGIIKFITEARHRVSQSVKSMAETYYRIDEKGVSMMQTKDSEENKYQKDKEESNIKIVEDVTKLLVVYKYIDKKAKDLAQKICKPNSYIANMIVEGLINPKYEKLIRTALSSYLRELKNINQICSSQYIQVTSDQLMSKSKKLQNLKTCSEKIVTEILKNSEIYQKYAKFERQAIVAVVKFTGFYLTLVLRHNIC